MSNLLWTKWHWHRFLSEHPRSPLSVSFHQRSVFILSPNRRDITSVRASLINVQRRMVEWTEKYMKGNVFFNGLYNTRICLEGLRNTKKRARIISRSRIELGTFRLCEDLRILRPSHFAFNGLDQLIRFSGIGGRKFSHLPPSPPVQSGCYLFHAVRRHLYNVRG
jgi:hypothetical protein